MKPTTLARSALARGFSLIELMVTLAIVGIAAAVAYPSYTAHVVKGNRGAAQSYMLSLATAQTQYLADTRSYGTMAELAVSEPTAVSTRYTVTISPVTATTYTITATPLAGSPQAGDVTLTLDHTGARTPAASW